jgi:hypothetical protein
MVKRDGKSYRIRILEIRHLSGNNPLDPVEPLLNYNGQRVQTGTELVNVIANGGGSGSAGSAFAACVRSPPMYVVAALQGPNGPRTSFVYGGNMNIDAQTLQCTDPPPGTLGQGSFSFTWLQRGGGLLMDYFAGSPPPNMNDWQWEVNGVLSGAGYSVPNQTLTLIAVSLFGPRLEMLVRVDDAGVGVPVLNVISIRRLI